MTEISPPARRRPPVSVGATGGVVSPPPRRRSPVELDKPEVIAPPRRRAPVEINTGPHRDDDWFLPASVRPLGAGQQSHNGVKKNGQSKPDPRFKPLIILLDPFYRVVRSPLVSETFNRANTMTVEKVSGLPGYVAGNYYIMEFILREKMGYRLIPDDVFEALRAKVIASRDPKDKERVNDAQLSMSTFTDDGDVVIDFTKAAGPWYCDTLLAFEFYYRDKLQPLK